MFHWGPGHGWSEDVLDPVTKEPVKSFWPDSNEFGDIMTREQKIMPSTVYPDSEEAELPFRDALFVERGKKLLETAAATQRATGSPFLIAVGLSLPHEPLRFPKWCWDVYDIALETSDSSTMAPAAPSPPENPSCQISCMKNFFGL